MLINTNSNIYLKYTTKTTISLIFSQKKTIKSYMEHKQKSLLIFLTQVLSRDLIHRLCFQFSNTISCKAKYPVPGGSLPCSDHTADTTAPEPISETRSWLTGGDDTSRALAEVADWETTSHGNTFLRFERGKVYLIGLQLFSYKVQCILVLRVS